MNKAVKKRQDGRGPLVVEGEERMREIGLEDEAVEGVVEILKKTVANIQILYVKTLHYHWNIVGSEFYSIHTLLDEQYNALKEAGDSVAERIRGYGVPVVGRMADFLKDATIKETKTTGLVHAGDLAELVEDHEKIVRELREGIDRCAEEWKDQGAADLLTGLLQQHQDMAWMLRASSR